MNNNNLQLREFIEAHSLRNRASVTFFKAKINMSTFLNTIFNKEVNVLITLNNYNSFGTVTFIDNNLDVNLYPTKFEAEWQDMVYLNNSHLKISGKHTKNNKIGKYIIEIYPLYKLRD